ncbi:MAG TPA: ATP-binding protein [Anaeromyxobacteraceae bacterium]
MSAGDDWQAANQRHLSAALAVLAGTIDGAPSDEAEAELRAAAEAMPAPPALEALAAGFGLSSFERDIVLLCAGPELDASFPLRSAPTFGLALARLPDAHWTALGPGAPLRRWRLIEMGAGTTLAASPLRAEERVLHYLAGVSYTDEQLQGLLEPVDVPPELPASHRDLAHRIAAALARSSQATLQLGMHDSAAARAIAAAACASLGQRVLALEGADIPVAAYEREALERLWEREAVLGGGVLLLELGELEGEPELRSAASFVDGVHGPLLVSGRAALATRRRPIARLDSRRPSAAERAELWRAALGETAASLNGSVDALASQFDIGANGIRAAAATAAAEGPEQAVSVLWEACRAWSRPGLDGLARRVEPAAGWDDLVLPERQREILRELAAHVRRRPTVYDDWGFGAQASRGLGVSALFAGASGTGKTMAAEVLAGELALDLYCVDLSSVVSKYIGETEKNLRRVFDAAEGGGAILLFDEADALFGKRTEVKDSHDRYANIEVSYLLQRMEAYRGLAVLTTNMKEALDPAFMRRLRFVVQFPFPDAGQRAEIWRRIFPERTPTEGLRFEELARLNVAGGNIRSIALNAAFLAVDAGEPVRMSHLARAARTEYAKLEKPLIETEVGSW